MERPQSKRGRRKIAIELIKDKNHLGVTFTKRRNGLFKKANELVALCGAQVLILLFSPGNKLYSFGHPNVNAVLDRFFGKNPQGPADVNDEARNLKAGRIHALNAQLKEIEMLVQRERCIAKQFRDNPVQGHPIAMMPRGDLTYPQMLELRAMALDLHQRISSVLDQRPGFGNDRAAGIQNIHGPNNLAMNHGPNNPAMNHGH